MKRENFTEHKKDNRSYNQVISQKVNNIFQHQDIGTIGYVMSTEESIKNNRHRYRVGEYLNGDDIQEIDLVHLKNNDLVGLNEKILASYLLNSHYSTIILTGAMGSGKTTTSNFVINFLEQNLDCSTIQCNNKCKFKRIQNVHLDFNEGFRRKNPDLLLNSFEKKFYEKLKRSIKPIFEKNIAILDAFIERIKNRENNKWESEFEDFITEYVEDDIRQWTITPKRKKVNILFKWIKEQDDYINKANLLGYLIKFTIENRYISRNCFIIFFDNIDQLPEIVQNDIILSILSFTYITKNKALITVRLTTFGWIPSKATYVWDQINHAGPTPMNIIKKRINQYLQIEALNNPKHFTSYSHLFNRLDIVYSYLNKPSSGRYSRLYKAIEAISGNSIRRALNLISRLFVNDIVVYNNAAVSENDLIRTLFISDDNYMLTPKDSLVCNLFNNSKDNCFTLIKIKILQILSNYKDEEKVNTLQNLYLDLLKHFKTINKNELLAVINDLLNTRRRLIYVDGYGVFTSMNDFNSRNNAKVEITYTGKLYLDSLINDYIYFQESIMTIHWEHHIGLPDYYNFRNFIELIAVIRKILSYIYDMDLDSNKVFLRKIDFNPKEHINIKTNWLFSIKLIQEVAATIVRLTDVEKCRNNIGSREEINKLYEFVIDVQRRFNNLFGKKNKGIRTTIREFEKKFNDLL